MLSKTAFNRMKKAELVEWALEAQRTAGQDVLFADDEDEGADLARSAGIAEARLAVITQQKKEIEELKKEIEAVKIVDVRDDGTPCVVDQDDWDYLAPEACHKYAAELEAENESFKKEIEELKKELEIAEYYQSGVLWGITNHLPQEFVESPVDIIGDICDYIEELKKEIEELKGEVREEEKEVNKTMKSWREKYGKLKKEKEELKEEIESLKIDPFITEESAINYVYENTDAYDDWVKGSNVYEELKEEMKEIEEQLAAFQMSHPCEMECGYCGCTITEDDLELSLGCGGLICEGCHDAEGKVDTAVELVSSRAENNVLEIALAMVKDENEVNKKNFHKLMDEKKENEQLKEEIAKLKKENQNFKAICTEYLDGTEHTANPVCLSQAVEGWTDEIVQLKEESEDYEGAIESLKKEIELKAEIESLKKVLAPLMKECWQIARTETESFRKEIEELKTKNRYLESKLVDIKRHYDAGHLADDWQMDDDYRITPDSYSEEDEDED